MQVTMTMEEYNKISNELKKLEELRRKVEQLYSVELVNDFNVEEVSVHKIDIQRFIYDFLGCVGSLNQIVIK